MAEERKLERTNVAEASSSELEDTDGREEQCRKSVGSLVEGGAIELEFDAEVEGTGEYFRRKVGTEPAGREEKERRELFPLGLLPFLILIPSDGMEGFGERRERAAGERSSRVKKAEGVKSPQEISAIDGARCTPLEPSPRYI